MKLYPIETGNFKLDGGAMFGTIPKSIWQKTNPADGQNKIELAMRALLIEDGDRLILIDCGIGKKQSEKFFSYYDLWSDYDIETSLALHGFTKDDITDVFLTHLHFDHCGGAVQQDTIHGGYELSFKNAKYWSNASHWDWATNPNPREKASFLPENFVPIKESGNLNLIDLPTSGNYLNNSPLGFDIIFVDGHTDKQMLPVIRYKGKTIVFTADLIATAGHVPLVYVMGYDTRPLLTMQEKSDFLEKAVQEEYLFFFEHDPYRELATVVRTEKGILLDSTYSFTEVFG
ncbi:MBL fold metallo-hydrolase [Moheibacter stercoris]|uniref:Glyoxylase-like metal-dependent hydrolase (Beta-lactamase superfamily II) n=1 Tax=Moheibacter stercoris TaxID=1628251 RepID=A0ABV2LPT8_9FLAO